MEKTGIDFKTKRKKVVSRIVCFCLMLAIICGSTKPVYAASENEIEYSFETDRVMHGIYNSTWLYFQIPEYWEISGTSAHIAIKISPMVLDVPADLTFYLGDKPVYSMKVDYTNGSEQVVDIPLDISDLKAGSNSFHVNGSARLYDEEGCFDDKSEANWIIIEKESCLKFSYKLKDTAEIADYPYSFLSTQNENGEGLAIVLPDAPSDGELTAAGWIRADLAGKTKGSDCIEMTLWSNYAEDSGNAIYVGVYQNLEEDLKALIKPVITADKLTEKNAFLYEYKADNKNTNMVVTAENEENLIKAVRYLIDDEVRSQREGSCLEINTHDFNVNMAKVQENYTIADLLGSKNPWICNGAFRQEQTLYIPQKGRVLGKSGTMDLSFRYSKNLDFTKSMLTVLINQTPVASHRLSEEKADGDHLEFTIPDDMTGEEVSSITFAFDLELPDIYCTYQLRDLPWVMMDTASEIYLPVSTDSILSFDYIPYPFMAGGSFKDAVFVLPDSLTPESLSLLGQVISLYSDVSPCVGSMDVVTESHLSEEKKVQSNLIFVGALPDFQNIDELRDSLPFSFDQEKSRYLGNEEFMLSDSYGDSVSVMELIPSPYGDEKNVLFAVSASESVMEGFVGFLEDKSNRSKLSGDTVIVDANGDIRTFEFQTMSQKIERPSLRERIENHKESIIFSLISTSAILLILLASIIILIRARRLNGKEHKKS